MGQFLCKAHGMQSLSFVSPAIAEKVVDGLSIKDLHLVQLTLQLPFNKKGLFSVDQKFLDDYKISSEVNDKELAFDIYDSLQPVCSKCLQKSLED